MRLYRKNPFAPVRAAIQLLALTGLILAAGCEKANTGPEPSTGPTWRSFTRMNSPLPDPQINALVISKNDVIWVGTANGLARFQESQWTIFNTTNSALPSNVVQALTLQPDGTVWVGTNKGLASYDGTQWAAYTPENSVLPDRAVMSLAFDAVNQLTWVGTAQGIVSINADREWHLFDEISGDLVFSMAADHDGALWLGTHEPVSFRGRIRRFYKGQWKTYQLDQMGFESAFPYAVGVDRNNAVVAILAGTVVSTAIRFTATGWTELAKPANAYGLRALALRGNEVWVGGTGLLRFDAPGTARVDIPQQPSSVLSMATDSKGDLWLGTAGGGIAVYHP